MKVLLISPLEGVVGGIAVWTRNILSYIDRTKMADVVLCDYSRNRTGQMAHNSLYKWLSACHDYFHLLRKALKMVRGFDGEVVHICSSASLLLIKDYFIAKVAKRKGFRVIVHFHFGRIPQLSQADNWEWKLLRKVATLADATVVMDDESYSVLSQSGVGIVKNIPNPLSDSTVQLIDTMSIARKEKLILYAGHCIQTKGIFELLKACKSIPGIRLRFIGAINDEITNELNKQAGDAFQSSLEILGQQSYADTIAQMLECDVFVLPSYTEGFPNVILEAMACGCPIIATSVGAIPQMIGPDDSGACGMVIEPKSEKAVGNALKYMLSHPEAKERMGLNARQRVRQRYAVDNVMAQLSALWRV